MECMQGSDSNGGFSGVTGDDFFVNQLLDFNGFSETEFEIETEKEESKKKGEEEEGENLILSNQEFVPLPQTEISVPAEDLEEMASLEWLNHLVEDSFSVYSLTGKLPPKQTEIRNERAVVQHCFTTPVRTKARTKRVRSGVRLWPVFSSPSFAADSSTSSSSSTLSTTSFSPSKKQRKKNKADAFAGGPFFQPRKCSHCGVTKTPQWRAGPHGLKTLCNACGVRFKSGRLLPEYRPALSPTYSNVLHSNNHRKVLEMRRKREAETETGGLTRTQPVQSF